jgi:hypothetical protein
MDAGKTKRRNVIGYVTFPLRDLPVESEQTLYRMDLEKVSTAASRTEGKLHAELSHSYISFL